MERIVGRLTEEFATKREYVENVITMLDEGATVPFISRYRKEMHGDMDVRSFSERYEYMKNLEARKDTVIASIEEQGAMTDELRAKIGEATLLTQVEDLYLPFKPKKKTRASIAKARGLEPLADLLLSKETKPAETLAADFLNDEVPDAAAALQGASDIIAERISENADVRSAVRDLTFETGTVSSVRSTEEETVYDNYYDFHTSPKKIQGHQCLAINRAEKEGALKVKLEVDDGRILDRIGRMTLPKKSAYREILEAAAEDSYDRLIKPSIERDIRSALTETAEDGAIHNFKLNLRALLMQAIVPGKVIMGLDPGFAHGCKIGIIDAESKVLTTDVVYLHQKDRMTNRIKQLCDKYKVDCIAIGNGTASRESEEAVAGLGVDYVIVSEAGASVYSVSKLAEQEFPDYDTNVRSAISIARRLQDPLAELVKIDPKSIGVGQYQHDINQKKLTEALDGVVEDCVNAVGVNVNTSSAALLEHISGLNATTAKNIVQYRTENGAFRSRKQLLKVPRLGAKAYEQCAGFLRVSGGDTILDNTGIHPESYEAAEKLLGMLGYTLDDVANERLGDFKERAKKFSVREITETCGAGKETMIDIGKELCKPGRDMRESMPAPVFKRGIMGIDDLEEGMVLDGTVRNVIDFGAFVDIGVHQDGLVHISEIANKFIKHPSEVLTIGQTVKVKIIKLDKVKKRISLSIKQAK
nr:MULTISPECIES: Tex family protein [unclassified Ruminococcus]